MWDILIYVLFTIILFVLGFILFSFFKAYKIAYELSHPKRSLCPYNFEDYEQRKFDIGNKNVRCLCGMEITPSGKQIGTILACHYLGGSKEMIFPFIEPLLQKGFRILSFDFHNHGESKHNPIVAMTLEKDFELFYDAVKSMGIKGPFGVIGFSMGATPALLSLANHKDIKAAVVDSGPLIFVKNYFTYVLKDRGVKNPVCKIFFYIIYLKFAGFNQMADKVIRSMYKVKGKPVMFIHGEKDNIIPIENSRVVYDIIKSELTEWWSIPGSRHLTNYFLQKKEYCEKITDFFIKNLKEEAINYEASCVDLSQR